MDTLQRGIITLIRSGITGEVLTLPVGFDMEKAYLEVVRHQVQSLAYQGALQCGLAKDLPVMRKLFQGYCRCMTHTENQLQTIERICAEFDDAGVDYMLLKGCNLKRLYPKPELRLMGDADILIRTEQYNLIRPIMQKLRFTEQAESDHELIWNTKALQLELHKRLIPSYNKDYYRYFGDGWKLAKRSCGTRFEMEKEDEFVYLFTHFAKHYRDGGIGCRHVTDLWVYRRAYPNLDEDYIDTELKKLQLLDFYRNIQTLIAAWFEDSEWDEKTRFLTDFVFESGSWGEHKTHVISAGVRAAQDTGSAARGRVKRAMRMLFPSALDMRRKYPILRPMPFLLPVCWIIRWVTAVLFRRENIRRQRRALAISTADEIKTYQQALDYVGLDFRFKE